MKYFQKSKSLEKDSALETILENFQTLEDFREAERERASRSCEKFFFLSFFSIPLSIALFPFVFPLLTPFPFPPHSSPVVGSMPSPGLHAQSPSQSPSFGAMQSPATRRNRDRERERERDRERERSSPGRRRSRSRSSSAKRRGGGSTPNQSPSFSPRDGSRGELRL